MHVKSEMNAQWGSKKPKGRSEVKGVASGKADTGSKTGLTRSAWQLLTWCSIGAGAAGLVLPLLPTTPFLLIAAWSAPKASPGLNRWLHTHRHFGPTLRAWREERAVPIAAKATAGILLLLSWILLFLLDTAPLLLGLLALMFIGILCFLLSRPNPRGSPP